LKADPTRSLLNRQRFHTHQGFPQWADLSRKTPPSSRQTAPLAYRNARSVDPFAAAPLRAARKDTTVHASLPSLHCQRAIHPQERDEGRKRRSGAFGVSRRAVAAASSSMNPIYVIRFRLSTPKSKKLPLPSSILSVMDSIDKVLPSTEIATTSVPTVF